MMYYTLRYLYTMPTLSYTLLVLYLKVCHPLSHVISASHNTLLIFCTFFQMLPVVLQRIIAFAMRDDALNVDTVRCTHVVLYRSFDLDYRTFHKIFFLYFIAVIISFNINIFLFLVENNMVTQLHTQKIQDVCL
jgi:hypothetical protein